MLPQDTQSVSNRSSHHTLKETKQRETEEQRVCKMICHEQTSEFHYRALFSHKALILERHKWQNTENGKKTHKKSFAVGGPRMAYQKKI